MRLDEEVRWRGFFGLLSIILLYSVPIFFENFRVTVKARDTLSTPEALHIKIVEEGDACKNYTQNAITAAKNISNKKTLEKEEF